MCHVRKAWSPDDLLDACLVLTVKCKVVMVDPRLHLGIHYLKFCKSFTQNPTRLKNHYTVRQKDIQGQHL